MSRTWASPATLPQQLGRARVSAVTDVLQVLLVDDQAMMRAGFSMILSVEDDIEVVGEASNGAEAIQQVAALRPDLVLMDVQMPVMDGIAACEQIVANSAAKVVLITTFDRDDYLFDGLRAGASGFLLKNAEPEKLVEAVRAAELGHALLSPEVTVRVIAQMANEQASGAGPGADAAGVAITDEHRRLIATLTEREREVLGLIGHGRSNAEIAAELFVGEATVKTHVSNIFAKLHLRDRVQAVVFAYESGLVRPGQA